MMGAAKSVGRAELLRACEDEAQRILDQTPEHIRAIIYQSLYRMGMRFEQTDAIIRRGIDQLMARPPL